jgi:hypothetical protein
MEPALRNGIRIVSRVRDTLSCAHHAPAELSAPAPTVFVPQRDVLKKSDGVAAFGRTPDAAAGARPSFLPHLFLGLDQL